MLHRKVIKKTLTREFFNRSPFNSLNFHRNVVDLAALRKKFIDEPEPIDGKKLKLLTASEAACFKVPPSGTRMLSREFIDDCLYNPHYGYFSKQAVIYSPEIPIQLDQLKDSIEFLNLVADKYRVIEDDLSNTNDIARQVWHTPTELFKPWYGHALAKYIASQSTDDKPLVIYEMGAGNGTLMLNIMDYLREHHYELYLKTRYRIIEISPKLADRQQENSLLADAINSHRNISIINKSIFDWDSINLEPCFFIALEVLDNFSHDVIAYDTDSGYSPMQGLVLIGEDGTYEEVFEPVSDTLIQEYIETRAKVGSKSPITTIDKLKTKLPFSQRLIGREFLPTRAFQFIQLLNKKFPKHRLIMSDFFKLPDTIPGQNGPVVQTRYRNTMVPCSTYLVQPGYFDIFFPTDFELFKRIYDSVCSYPEKKHPPSKILAQSEFLKCYGNLERTTTKSGETPFLNYYENNKFFLS